MNSHCFKLIDLIQFLLICKIVAKFFWGVEYLNLENKKENSCAVFTNSIKQVREIRKFQVADLQQQLRNVPKNLVYVQSCCFANVNR